MCEEAKRIGDIVGNSSLEKLPLRQLDCPRHGKYEGITIRLPWGEGKPICPKCEEERGEKEEKLKADSQKRQREIENEERISRLKNMNIGKKFWNEDFNTFNTYTSELEHFYGICTFFVENPEGRILVMLGNHGNGKNHLASAILKRMGGYMYSVFEMELLIRQTYTKATSEWELYERLSNAPLLVINEIGKHKLGDWDNFFLSYIINKRYENLMPIILVSNAHLKENCPKSGCDMCFENYLGNDVISRIIECGETMTFTGEDYRQKIREARIEAKK